jgi:hypothetical protein
VLELLEQSHSLEDQVVMATLELMELLELEVMLHLELFH